MTNREPGGGVLRLFTGPSIPPRQTRVGLLPTNGDERGTGGHPKFEGSTGYNRGLCGSSVALVFDWPHPTVLFGGR
jgi:hypothetical protein